jgi:hypothetical protein
MRLGDPRAGRGSRLTDFRAGENVLFRHPAAAKQVFVGSYTHASRWPFLSPLPPLAGGEGRVRGGSAAGFLVYGPLTPPCPPAGGGEGE